MSQRNSTINFVISQDQKSLAEKKAKISGYTLSEYVRSALTQKIEDADDITLVLKKLNTIERNQHRAEERELAIISILESFAKIFFLTMPELSDEDFATANTRMERIFLSFVQEVKDNLVSGGMIVSEINNQIRGGAAS